MSCYSWDRCPVIAGIDVLTEADRPVVVAFGDSITDNTGCLVKTPVRCRWSDVLGTRMTDADMPHVVVTQAIGGNRLLTPSSSMSGLARFDRDVLSIPGVTHIVMLLGINDINSGVIEEGLLARDLIAGYRQTITRAHEHGIKVIASLILPYRGAVRFTQEREAVRQEVNAWFRTSGEFNRIVDLERVAADPKDPSRLAPGMGSKDGLHPGPEGQEALGRAIPLDLFL